MFGKAVAFIFGMYENEESVEGFEYGRKLMKEVHKEN